ncbi:MAG TPA: ABC transporter ATP-binding protein [Nannocystaceae bacterium]|nr:ABC transporter ATP-binding protein [Nannocystaceae bacterium]
MTASPIPPPAQDMPAAGHATPAAAGAALECVEVCVRVPGRLLIENLTVRLAAGRIVVVLGRNGAGKSSLLHTLAGLNPHASGTVLVDGRSLDEWPRRELARRVALLPQASDDPFPGTTLETVLVGRHPHIGFWRWEDAHDREVAQRSLAATDLAGCDEREVDTLSGGERRRLAIAAVLAQEPVVFLLDEPIQQLDPHHQVETLKLFRAEADRGRLVIRSLHDVGLAARYADDAILLHGDGRWLYGPAATVLNEQELGALYGTRIRELRWADGRTFVAV